MIERTNAYPDELARQIHFQFGTPDQLWQQLQRRLTPTPLAPWILYVQPWPVQMRQERTFYYLSRAESQLLAAEKLAAFNALLGLDSCPDAALRAVWQNRLLWVYDHNWGGKENRGGSDFEKLASAKSAMDLSQELVEARLERLCAAIQTQHPQPIVVFNPLNWKRDDVVTLTVPAENPDQAVLDDQGKPVPFHWSDPVPAECSAASTRCLSFLASGIPSLGYRTFHLTNRTSAWPASPLQAGTHWIENSFYRLTWNHTAQRLEVFDKIGGRPMCLPTARHGPGHLVAEDVSQQPKGWLDGDPALDGAAKITDELRVHRVQIEMDTPLSVSLTLAGKIEQSPVMIRWQLWSGINRIDGRVELDYAGVAPRVLYLRACRSTSVWQPSIPLGYLTEP